MSPPPLSCTRSFALRWGQARRGQLFARRRWRPSACPTTRLSPRPRLAWRGLPYQPVRPLTSSYALMRVAGWSCARVTSGLVELLPRAASRAREVARSTCPLPRASAEMRLARWHAGVLHQRPATAATYAQSGIRINVVAPGMACARACFALAACAPACVR